MFNKVIINQNNLIENIKQVKRRNQRSKVCAMVKADAYGIGVECAVKILDKYVDFFGVACFFEAQKIKKLTKKSILIVGGLEKAHIDGGFSYSCGNIEDLKFLKSLNLKIKIHLKINSGMNRFGFKNLKEFSKVLKMICNSKLVVEGIYTHFATSDKFVKEQYLKFKKFVKLCFDYGFKPIVHADNSLVNENFNHNLDMVRVGYDLFIKNNNQPVVEIKSEIVEIQEVKRNELVGYGYNCVAEKPKKVAIVPIGYADGFDRGYIGIKLKVEQCFCEVLNICMDCFMLDISKTRLKKGDEIYILNKFNSLKRYAIYDKTHEYEILTRFKNIRADRDLVVTASSY